MLKSNPVISIAGPVGQLETLVLHPEAGRERGVAVLNHPNPLYGGTHHNKVIQTAAKTLQKMGYVCYLPNVRGTGKSEGEHDYGVGESDDVLNVWEYVRRAHPDLMRRTVLGGFSFGGYVSTRVAAQVACDQLLLIGAAVSKYAEPAPAVPDIERTLMIHGAQDEVIALEDVLAWCAPQNLPLIVLAEAGHFFHGKLPQLAASIERFFRED
ncbi:MAG: alpha/beta fold hydrolase [Neisseria sp.]|nr:alpha/beta fold hydrolase [Neisseria sp.]